MQPLTCLLALFRILTETRRIIDTVVQAIPPASAASRGPRRQRDALNQLTLSSLGAILEDLYVLTDGLENNRNAFDRDMRNFGAQQAMVLRDQKAWSTRTDTEFLHFTDDNAPSFAARAAAYAAASGRER